MASTRKDTPSKKKTTGRAAPARSAPGGKKVLAPKSKGGKAAPARASKAESAAKSGAKNTWNLRLYVAGDSPKSRTALENLRRLCDTHLGQDYHIEVVDLK